MVSYLKYEKKNLNDFKAVHSVTTVTFCLLWIVRDALMCLLITTLEPSHFFFSCSLDADHSSQLTLPTIQHVSRKLPMNQVYLCLQQHCMLTRDKLVGKVINEKWYQVLFQDEGSNCSPRQHSEGGEVCLHWFYCSPPLPLLCPSASNTVLPTPISTRSWTRAGSSK